MKGLNKVLLAFVLLVSILGAPLYALENDNPSVDKTIQEVSEEITSRNENSENTDKDSIEKTVLNNEGPIGKARLNVIASSESIEVGTVAQFQVYLSFDGLTENYTNVILTISLPNQVDDKYVLFNQDLNELSIRGVEPTYDATTRELKYYFAKLEGGFESSALINIATINGSPLNGEELVLKAELTGDSITSVTHEKTTLIVANQNASLSNKLKGVMEGGELVDRLSIRYLDEAVFSVGASVNKYTSGSLALKDGSKVTVKYQLADGLTYISDTSGVTPTFDGVTYTWEFDSNTNEDEEYFFKTSFEITVKVDGDLTLFSDIKNMAQIGFDYIDDSSKEYTVDATVMISPNFEYQLDKLVDGGAYSTIFNGPSDGLGNVAWLSNDDPSVTDGALLGWGFYITSAYSVHPVNKINSYNVFFHPDENTDIRNMYTGNYYMRPNSGYSGGKLSPMEDEIYISVKIKYADSEEWVEGKSNLRDKTYYSATEMGIDTNRKVKTVWFHYHDNETHVFWDDVGYGVLGDSSVLTIPVGLTTTNMRVWTTVDEGYLGSVEGKVGLGASGWNKTGNRVDFQSKEVPEEVRVDDFQDIGTTMESRLAPKTAQIVEAPTGISRYIRSNAYFETTKNSLLSKGDNTLRLQIINDSASVRQLVGPFETYVLIDQGVEFPDLSAAQGAKVTLVDSNYNNTGKSLLKVALSQKSLSIGNQASVLIPVTITDQAPYKLNIEYIGYYGEDFDVSTVTNTNGTFTVKEKDVLDINGSGVEEDVYVTRNSYILIDAYEFFGQALGSNDGALFTNHINVFDHQAITYQLGLNNPLGRPISTVNLIGTLPDVGDTYVLNDEAMNSKFAMNLTGAIKLPEAYEDSFEVYYSTSKEPLVAGVLDANTSDRLSKLDPTTLVDDQVWLSESEVTDFSLIRSYKIVMKSGVKPISDEVINFELNLEVAKNALTGEEAIAERIAYMSYAVGINDATVFESQSVNFVYNVNPVYEIIAKDVTMKLSDVNRMAKEGTLMSYILSQAGVVVTKNGVVVEDPAIVLNFINLETEYEVGMYDLLYVYATGEGKEGAMTVALLNIVADDAPIEDAPTLPSTGMGQNYFGMSLLALGSIALAASLLNKRRKHTN